MITTIDQELARRLNEWVVDGWPVGNLILCLIALVLSVIFCGLIGIEREWKGRSAGLRTHLLVGVGSCLIMIISIYGFPALFSEKRDVAILAAQIITGVGFLGAGAIMHRGSGVKGLTTAGTIWVVMAIGIACGSFNFILAAAGTILIFIVLTCFKRVEVKLSKRSPTIVLCAYAESSILENILKISKEFNCTVHGLSTELTEYQGKAAIEVTFKANFADEEPRVNEYVSELEKATKAYQVSLLGHR